MARRVNRGLLVVWLAALAAVAAVSLMPGPVINASTSFLDFIGDKGEHLAAYAVLAALAMGVFARLRTAVLAAALMAAYGVLLEFLQAAIAFERLFELGDMAFNAVGVLCGILAGLVLRRHVWPRAGVPEHTVR
jgi:hypothetical protein